MFNPLSFISKFIKSGNQKELDRIGKIILRVNSLEESVKSLKNEDIPSCECLKDTVLRFLPYWENTISPHVITGKRIMIVAHGNSLRALVKHLDNISKEDIVGLNIPTGTPLVYELDEKLNSIKNYYLGDQNKIFAKIASVANQGKSK